MTGNEGPTGRCRIIAGQHRSRIIRFHDAPGLRPTTDRMRETVFNWLQPYLPGSHCLDAFAGSGVLGFESLSRGADHALFIDANRQCVADIETNARLLLAEQVADKARCIRGDAVQWLKTRCAADDQAPFDVVFIDPPYHSGLATRCIEALRGGGCLSANAIIYVEHAVDDEFEPPADWPVIKHKRTANIVCSLLQARLP